MLTLLWLDFVFRLGKKDPPPIQPAWTTGDYIFYGLLAWFFLQILKSIGESSGRFKFSSKKKKEMTKKIKRKWWVV